MTRKKKEEVLTEEEVWDLIQFARSMSSDVYPGVLTPDIISGRMKDVTLSPLAATQEELDSALADPKNNEEKLRAYAENFEIQSLPYKRMIHYLANMLSFDLTYNCINAKPTDYKGSAYQKDLAIVEDFLDRFDYKKEFNTVVKQMIRGETFFGVLRDESERFVLQELPSNYCKITGRWDYGLLFSFNYYWFMQGGVSLNFYPPVFKRGFDEIRQSDANSYKPNLSIDDRGKSSWVYWVDCSPADNFWAWKFTPEIIARVPYFTALFSDLILQPLVRNLQKNQYIVSAQKLLVGEVALMNKDSKSSLKDSLSISPDLLGKFLALMKAGLSEEIKVASAPLQNIQGISFPLADSIDMYDKYLRTSLATSGINSNLLFTSGSKPNAIETQLSLNADEQLMTFLYPYFNAFLEYHINKRTKKFKFKFNFEGSEFYTNRQQRLSVQMGLLPQGIVLPQKISAAMGMRYKDFTAQLAEAKAMGFVDALTPIVTSFQQSMDGKGDKGGRPQKSDGELSESGSNTRSQGNNLERGGNV